MGKKEECERKEVRGDKGEDRGTEGVSTEAMREGRGGRREERHKPSS